MSMRALHIFGGAFVAATAAVMVSGPAFAASQESATVNVEFQRSDLKSGAGAEHVYREIRDAAQSACGDYGGWVHDLQRQVDMQQCEADAIADAIARINAPELNDIYDMDAPKHPLPSPG